MEIQAAGIRTLLRAAKPALPSQCRDALELKLPRRSDLTPALVLGQDEKPKLDEHCPS
jgi:hypothetical protein